MLWQALRPGGVYVVEDLSENYIESPFLDPETFIGFMKQAMDIVQCRMKPDYMEANSPVGFTCHHICDACHSAISCAKTTGDMVLVCLNAKWMTTLQHIITFSLHRK